METPPTDDNLHIKKILDYLPVIAIFVIVFIGFFTWDVVADKMSGFITLIGIFVFALWIYCGDPKTYLNWLGSDKDKFIIPAPAGAAAAVQGADNGLASLIPYIGVAVCILLGLGLGFGSIGVSRLTDYDPSLGLKISGGIIVGISIIGLVFSLWKIFGKDNNDSGSGSGSGEAGGGDSFKMKGVISFFTSIAGIYMIVRAQKIETEQKEMVDSKDTQKQKEYANGLASAGATTMLSFGLILQIIGVGMVLFFMFKNGVLHAPRGTGPATTGIVAKIIPFIPHAISAMLFISGMVLIAKSQRWPGFDNDDTAAVSSFDNKTFAAHGGIWTILSAVFLLIAAGRLEKFKTYNFMGWIIILALFALFGWSLYDLNKNKDEAVDNIIKTNDNSYYSQLKAEVTKDLKSKSAATVDATVTDAAIDAEMKNRIENTRDKNTQVTQIVSILFTIISIIICVFIIIFRNARLYIALCETLPASLWAAKTRLFVPVTDKAADCATKDSASIKDEHKTKIKNDTMKSTDWDEIIKKNDDDAAAGDTFSTAFVRLAKGAAWVPFLSVILLVLWVSILFTKVTTSESTNVWIANSFTGDMFPKVKELIDTFFIVLIVGLLLCGILLLPMVKELNFGGLDTILRFAESIQVWQYDGNNGVGHSTRNKWSLVGAVVIALLIMATIAFVFIYDVVPKDENNQTKWIVSSIIFMIGLCSIPGWYFLFSDNKPNTAFNNESIVIRLFRLMLTAIYLIPFFFVTIFKLLIFAIPAIFQNKDAWEKIKDEFGKFDFTSWKSEDTDLTLLGIGKIVPADVSSMAAAAAPATSATSAADAPGAPATSATGATSAAGISETKVSAVGKLIKVILLTISFVIMILATIYLVYKVGANNRNAEQDTASGGFVAKLNSPTAQVIYVIMAIVAVAGFVAYIREKFTKTNTKTPEDYLFDEYKPEDVNSPMRQLTFGMTHIIYVVLMIIVWVYDTDKDDKNRMSVTGMTVLGLAILFFHYFFEFIDNKKPGEPGKTGKTGADATPDMLPMSNLLTNIRFILNTIFLIVLCVLAYYKQHSVMVVLVVVMFIFHLTKSILGMKVLRLIWLCIIYIPCLFLGLLTSSQGAVGDTTRPIWIILAIEIILAAILFGGPYLLNYIGASNSQIVSAPTPLRPKNDTGLTTQSPQIFIFHNTALDRSDDDKAANCAPEEKKRYNYSVSGWFWLNNNVNATDHDLEIFNFGGVPKLTYNPSTTEFKVSCKTVSLSTGLPDASANIVYNSRFNYSNTKELKNTEQIKFDILNDSRTTDTQIPIQKWNYFVINYDGKSMDVFLNNVLVAKSKFFVPDIISETITSGDNGPTTNSQGLSGNICNVAFHKEPLTLEQIRWTYSMLKSEDPPMIGMKTIADEVKTTGTTNMYSQ